MRIGNFIVWFWLVTVCVASKKGRGRLRPRRCGCKAIYANVNTLIDEKLKYFRDDLLQSTVSLPESAREKLWNHKLSRLNQDIVSVRTRLLKQESTLANTRTSMSQHKQAISNISHKIERIEHMAYNMTSALKTVNRFVTSSNRNQVKADKSTKEKKQTAEPLPYPRDCDEVYQNGGLRYRGEYYIYIRPSPSHPPFKVLCHAANNSGWAVFQRRKYDDVDFRRTWSLYKKGFGRLTGDFWLGNDKLHYLTAQGGAVLRVEMGDWRGNKYYAEYDQFSIEDERNLYKIHVAGYHGTAGDSLSGAWRSHDGQPFSTRDRDNDKRFYDNCAEHYSGAWWFTDCFESHLNGKYYGKGNHKDYFVRDGIHWKSIHPYSSLKYTLMMTRARRSKSSALPNTNNNLTKSTTGSP